MKARTAKLFALLAALAAAACGNANPEDLPPVNGEPDASVPDEAEPVALTITPSSVNTPWESVPITGTGPANGTLVYEAQVGGEDTVRLGSTGEFCLDVPLVEGDNSIRFEAISEAGKYSEVEHLSVRREGEPPEIEPVDPGDAIIADRTPGTVFYMAETTTPVPGGDREVYLDAGEFPQLVDGNTNQLVSFHSLGSAYARESIAFTLDEQMAVHGFELSVGDYGGETCGPQAYEIWISDEEQPEMHLDGLTWVKVAERDSDATSETATTYEDVASVPGILAKHVAVRIMNSSCEHWFAWTPRTETALAELRVLAEDGDGVPVITDGAPSCARGGF